MVMAWVVPWIHQGKTSGEIHPANNNITKQTLIEHTCLHIYTHSNANVAVITEMELCHCTNQVLRFCIPCNYQEAHTNTLPLQEVEIYYLDWSCKVQPSRRTSTCQM